MSETVSAKSVSPKMKRSPKWHSRVPASVSLDLSISSDAFRIYSVMALWAFQGSVVYIGMRQLAKLTGLSPATTMRRLRDLVDAGHVIAKKDANGKRNWYELNSPVFGQKQRALDSEGGVEELISRPRRRLATAKSA